MIRKICFIIVSHNTLKGFGYILFFNEISQSADLSHVLTHQLIDQATLTQLIIWITIVS